MTAVVCGLGLLQPSSRAAANAWTKDDIYPTLCYSDIALPLPAARRLRRGRVAVLPTDPAQEPLEYPVLTGAFMSVAPPWSPTASTARRRGRPQPARSSTSPCSMLVGCALATSWLIARTHRPPALGRRAVRARARACCSTGVRQLGPARRRADRRVGCWRGRAKTGAGRRAARARRSRRSSTRCSCSGRCCCCACGPGSCARSRDAASAAAVAWLVVNLPVYARVAATAGRCSTRCRADRGAGFGSLWYALRPRRATAIPRGRLNAGRRAARSALLLPRGRGARLVAPRRPRLAQLAFLVVAAFA